MTDVLHPLDEHGLPELLNQARALARGQIQDLSPLGDDLRLFDISGLDRVVVEGRDRIRFLHAMLSNDIASLQPGQGRWATLNSVQGKTVSDVRIFVLDDDKKKGSALALLEPGAAELFTEELDRYIIADKCYFSPDSEHSMFLVAGAGTDQALSDAGASLPAPGPLSHCATELGGAPVRLFRLDRTSTSGDDLGVRCATADVEAVLGALAAIQPGSSELLEAARIEGGVPRFGIDFSAENIPLEAGLKDLAISFTKGCYVGQEVICRIDSMGSPKRRLVRLEAEGSPAPAPGTLLFAGDRSVGWTTSVARTPSGWLAFAYVKKRHNEPGTELMLGSAEGPAIVVGEPVGNV